MKKFVLLFFCMFLMVRLFAQTNFRELNLAKALESANSEGKDGVGGLLYFVVRTM